MAALQEKSPQEEIEWLVMDIHFYQREATRLRERGLYAKAQYALNIVQDKQLEYLRRTGKTINIAH